MRGFNLYRSLILILLLLIVFSGFSQNAGSHERSFKSFDSLLNATFAKLEKLNLDNPVLLGIQDFNLCEIEDIIASLELSMKKNLDITNEISLKERIYTLKQEAGKRRVVLNQKLANLDYLFFNAGEKYYNQNNYNKARSMFLKSIETNYFYSMAHAMLAKIELKEKNYLSAAEKISETYNTTYPSQTDRTFLYRLSVQVKDAYFRNIDTFFYNNQYSTAIQEMENAAQLCQKLQINCSDEILQRKSKAIFEIYKAHLSIAKRALESGQPAFAEQYIAKAKAYQQENLSYIPQSSEADELFASLADAYKRKGITLISLDEFQDAIEHLNKALYFCERNNAKATKDSLNKYLIKAKKGIFSQFIDQADSLIEQNKQKEAEEILVQANSFLNMHNEIKDGESENAIADLMKRLYSLEYQNYLNIGVLHYKQYEFVESLASLEQAKEMGIRYRMTENPELDSLIKRSAKPLVLNILGKAYVGAWGKDTQNAKAYLDEAIALQKKYKLELDADINAKIEKVNQRM